MVKHYYENKPISVRLPNDNFSIANFSGTMSFSPGFDVHNVLYISDFSFNLLSVSKLCTSLNCVITFLDSKCVLQEQKSQRMIGLGEQCQGLSYLVVDANDVVVSSVSSGSNSIPAKALWHFKLVHLSNNTLTLVHSQFPFVRVDRKGVCDACHYARHKKSSYSLS